MFSFVAVIKDVARAHESTEDFNLPYFLPVDIIDVC